MNNNSDIQIGDVILEINNIDTIFLNFQQVVEAIRDICDSCYGIHNHNNNSSRGKRSICGGEAQARTRLKKEALFGVVSIDPDDVTSATADVWDSGERVRVGQAKDTEPYVIIRLLLARRSNI